MTHDPCTMLHSSLVILSRHRLSSILGTATGIKFLDFKSYISVHNFIKGLKKLLHPLTAEIAISCISSFNLMAVAIKCENTLCPFIKW